MSPYGGHYTTVTIPELSIPGDLLHNLSDPRRRYVLYLLLENEQANVENLSLQIAAWENDVSVSAVSAADHRAVRVGLVHNHLPRLAEHDVIEYDRRSGDLVRGDRFESIRPVVEQVRAIDEQGEHAQDAPESVAAD